MINDNVLEWLVKLLENNEELSDYSLEYASALFMNLSLRSAGKKRLANDYKNTLKVISELLGNSNTEVSFLERFFVWRFYLRIIKRAVKLIILEVNM